MDMMEIMRQRHSVRRYIERPIDADSADELQAEIDRCNAESGLHIQLILNEPRAFGGLMAHYGSFSGVTNYIALIGRKGSGLDEACGYFGERIVLAAQAMGLNTCWVAATYRRIPEVLDIAAGEKLTAVIAVGYGMTQGVVRKSKPAEAVSNVSADTPEWFRRGVEAALLAPTAVNQQQFYFTYREGRVTAKAKLGFCAKMDLGIVKYHFELGSGVKVE